MKSTQAFLHPWAALLLGAYSPTPPAEGWLRTGMWQEDCVRRLCWGPGGRQWAHTLGMVRE